VLLGAIINVAVAWGCVLWGHKLPNSDGEYSLGENIKDGGPWPVAVFDDWPARYSYSFDYKRTAYTISSLVHKPVDCTDQSLRAEITNAGIPLRALCSLELSHWSGDQQFTNHPPGGIWDAGINPPSILTNRTRAISLRLPLRPIWPGFAINTIFYAAVLWIVFAIPGGVKRFRRRRRGHCIHCGYDLRGQPPPEAGQSTKCPECGKVRLMRFALLWAVCPRQNVTRVRRPTTHSTSSLGSSAGSTMT
jgi:hypothetical protein